MNCYVCGLNNIRSRKGRVRDNPALKIMECCDCGLVFLNCRAHVNSEHYERSGMHGDKLPSIASWMNAAERDDERRFNMLKPVLVNRNIMDFGCGAGGFLNKTAKLAKTAVGIELEQRVREYWNGQLAIFSDVESARLEDGYDIITAFHVVEHLPDPRDTLRTLASFLNSKGRLVIEVPNSEDVLLTLYDSEKFQEFTYWSQHLYLFNSNNLRVLAEQAGLQVVSIQQYQRYSLANHLYWLSNGEPGGHQQWHFLSNGQLDKAYADSLAAIGRCDTIIAYLQVK